MHGVNLGLPWDTTCAMQKINCMTNFDHAHYTSVEMLFHEIFLTPAMYACNNYLSTHVQLHCFILLLYATNKSSEKIKSWTHIVTLFKN